jgi:sulfoxide reductase heme-binding subunit YedZ
MQLWRVNFFRTTAHIIGIFPLAWLLFDYFNNNLTINPIQALTLRTGKYALILLLLSISVTPVHVIFGYAPILKIRRTLGLYAFFYVALHFFIFTGLDYGFDLTLLKGAILEKNYVIVGLFSGILLLLLAITSFKYWKIRLGRNWKKLHKVIYLAGILAILHYILVVKTDIRVPLAYCVVMVFLFVIRLQPVRLWIKKFPSMLRLYKGKMDQSKYALGNK